MHAGPDSRDRERGALTSGPDPKLKIWKLDFKLHRT
jgi:hypothetical protein